MNATSPQPLDYYAEGYIGPLVDDWVVAGTDAQRAELTRILAMVPAGRQK